MTRPSLRTIILFGCASLIVPGASVHADVIAGRAFDPFADAAFSNLGFQNQQVADGFRLTQPTTLTNLSWYGRYGPSAPIPADPVAFSVRLFADDHGRPAAASLALADVSVTARPVGADLTGIPWFSYTAPLPTLTLGAGNYWISVLETDWRTPADWDTQWRWALADATQPPYAYRNRDGDPWYPGSGWNLAYTIEGTLPRLHVLAVGSTDRVPRGVTLVDGGADARAVLDRFGRFQQFDPASSTTITYDYRSPPGTSRDQVEHRLDDARLNRVKPGDTFVFFFSGRGGPTRVDQVQNDEVLALHSDSASPQATISDDDLVARFSRPGWESVNKLIILDASAAGGFADPQGIDLNDDGIPAPDVDLLALPRTAVLAAAPEGGETGQAPGAYGRFTNDVLRALEIDAGHARADTDGNGLTFEELRTALAQYAAEETDYNGILKCHPAPADIVPTVIHPSFAWAATDDFVLELTAQVPEPAFLICSALAWRTVIIRSPSLHRPPSHQKGKRTK